MKLTVCALIAVSWPWSHKKPVPPQASLIDPHVAHEVTEVLGELVDIQAHYPWLRKWAEPSLEVVNRLMDGSSASTDDDIEQLHHDLKALEAMENNDTI